MVFGGTASERIQLNEDTIWAGEKRERNNPAGRGSIAEIRRLLAEGKPKEAEALADRTMIAVPRRMPPYQPLGDLLINFAGHEQAEDYVRELDLDTGIVSVSYRVGDAKFTLEVFIWAVDQVLVVRLNCDKPGALKFSTNLTRERDSETSRGDSVQTIRGQAITGDRHKDERKVGVKFHGYLRLVPSVSPDTGTLLFSAATKFREQDPARKCKAYVEAALGKSYGQLRSAHVAEHQRLFRRVQFSLGAPTPDLPTDERLKRAQAGETDLALEALHFHFGRYLLIASSRPGTMAANLQGKWNDKLEPAWDSKYTINI